MFDWDKAEVHVKALREMGAAVVTIVPEDIQTLVLDDDTDEPKLTLDQAADWLSTYQGDVEEAILGDYWSDRIRGLLCFDTLEAMADACPNDDQGKHTPDEHGQCDDCRQTDVWSEDPDYPVAQWQYEVENDDTRQGYHDWVKSQKEQADA